jgi:hypothetical protein
MRLVHEVIEDLRVELPGGPITGSPELSRVQLDTPSKVVSDRSNAWIADRPPSSGKPA